jgi:hypothetical protein
VAGYLGVEAGGFRSDVDLPAQLGVFLPLGAAADLFGGAVTVAPRSAVLCSPPGGRQGGLGLGEVCDGAANVGVLVGTPSGVKVGPRLLGLAQGCPRLRQGRSEVGRLDPGDGRCGDVDLGMRHGGEVYPLLFGQAGDVLAQVGAR